MKFYQSIASLGLIFVLAIGSRAWAQETQAPQETQESLKAQESQESPEVEKAQEPEEAKKPVFYPAREVDRPLVLPDKLTELRLGFSYFDAERYFDEDGKSQSLEEEQEWRILQAQLEMGYGFLNWLEAGAGIPYYSGEIFKAEGDNLGDLYGFARFKILANQEKTRELGLNFKASFPTGDADIKMRYEKKQYFQENLRTGDPLLDFFVGPVGRLSFKNFALRAQAEYAYRMEGKIKYGLEGMENTVDFDPGEGWSANLDFLYQVLDKLVAQVSLDYYQQDANKLEGESLEDDWNLLQARAGIEIQFTPNYDLCLQAGIPISGKNQADTYSFILLWKSRVK